MENALQRLPGGARVAVIRLRSLGDCVLATPALALLRRSRPDAAIAVVVEERFAPLFEGHPDVDAVLPPRVCALRGWNPQLSLNLHGGTRSMVLTALSGAEVRAGFAHFRAPFVYNVRIPAAQRVLGVSRKVHTAEHLASAIFWLGAGRVEIPPARLVAERKVAARPYAILHPLAADARKRWPAPGFVAVAEHLRRSMGLEPVFLGGVGESLDAFGSFRTVSGAPLPEVLSLVAGASLFVGNDSGPAHIAAAFGIPVLVIFGASDPELWGPWKTTSEVVVARGPIEAVTAAEVIEALERLKVAA